MQLGKNIFQKYKHLLLATIFIFLTAWFEYLKKTIVPRHIMYAKIDSQIPFVKQFVFAYYTWFIYMAIGLTVLAIVSKRDYYKMIIFLGAGMSISFIIFILYPNGQFPRPVVEGNDIFSQLVKFIYSHDETNCVFPSIHVCNSIGVHAALVNCERFKDKKLFKTISFIICILICASTVFIKQHSIIDVFGGLILAAIIYVSIYHMPKLFEKTIEATNLEG